MSFSEREILETVRMVELETLDIRTTTLGISLFEMIVGRVPFESEKLMEVLGGHLFRVPPRLRQARPDANPTEDVYAVCYDFLHLTEHRDKP